jgi:hypothetical protein
MPFLGTGPILGSGSPTTEGSSMENRVGKLVMGVAALATVALGSATVASAVSNGDGQRSNETALTGDTATKVKEAALAKIAEALSSASRRMPTGTPPTRRTSSSRTGRT